MIALSTLKYLATQKQKDSGVLFAGNRFNGCVYMMGYALELSFKRKLSTTLGFRLGFPETDAELRQYYNAQLARFNAISTGITLNQITQIKHHRLTDLIKFSGAEARIVSNCYREWLLVCTWQPQARYQRQNWTRIRAEEFMRASHIILREIN